MTIPPQQLATRPRQWAPRIWEGCDFFAWADLLWRNRFKVEWPYWYIAGIVTIVSSGHTALRLIQDLLYGRKIRKSALADDPIFIIGHWRTGTTWLHELLILDERFTCPNTYECFDPNHFLLTEKIFRQWLSFLMPKRRPMDNMAAGWEKPQEDEFALCMMGQRSPYLDIAFPNHPPQHDDYLELSKLSPPKLAAWKRDLMRFLKAITYKDPRRLVLKSPPHSCRVPVLLEMFPNARFVHIVRNPYIVFPSTVNLWKSLYRAHGLQKPTFAGLEERVVQIFPRIYDGVEEARRLVRPERFFELRYESLVRDPEGEMQRLYSHLSLGGFAEYKPKLAAYLEAHKSYETNRYEMAEEWRNRIASEWGEVIARYGYKPPQPPS